jgi:hypothetical protein
MSTLSLQIDCDTVQTEAVQRHPNGVATQTLRLYRRGLPGPAVMVNLVWPPGVPPLLTTDFSPPHRGPLD